MQIVKMKVKELKPWEGNPRQIDEESLAGLTASVTRFGLVQPIIWNKRTKRVVGGHQRLKVLLAQGAKETDVVVVDLSMGQERAMNLALNNPAIAGDFSPDVEAILDEIAASDEDLYDDLRLGEIEWVDDTEGPEVVDDAVPDPPAKAITKKGDIWTLGEHRVLCGDCTNAGAVKQLWGTSRAAWMWTDPPYGVDYTGKTKNALKISSDNAVDLSALLSKSFQVADSILEEGAPLYIAHPPGVLSLQFGAAVLGVGWHFHETLVWVKDSMVLGHSDYHYKHEPILYGWRGKNRKWYGGRTQVTVLEHERPKKSENHPTMKPVRLVAANLQNSSRSGDVGYDPFLGSGTTLIAAEQLDRICYGLELEPRYCDVIVERWENLTGKKASRKSS